MTEAKLLARAWKKIEALEIHNQELVLALDAHRMVLEHYLSICAAVQADPKPAQEVLMKFSKLRTKPVLRSVK